ncbi:hypothetical protein [Clostridium sp. ZS2-4]|nr:hypothetical protein [Clostridium sp. ZS2-4]MCY6354366.1 hypothetical protein [Clostridium sp. ZS2-4]
MNGVSVLKLKEDVIAASEKYLYVTEERDKEEDTIILDEIS